MPNPRVSDVHIDRAISNVAIRYQNSGFVAEQVAPRVTVTKESDKYFTFTKGDWFRDEADDDRRPGTRAPRGGFDLSSEDYSLKEIAQASPIPDRIRDNADQPLRPYEDASEWASQMVNLRKERRCAATLFASSVWGTDKTVDNQWSDFVNSDPATDIAVGKDTVRQNTGQTPNRLLIGQEVFKYLRMHPDALDRFKHTQTGILTAAQVAQWLDVDQIIVGSAIVNTAKKGAADSMAYVWGKHCLLMYVTGSPSISEPSAAYVFQKNAIRTKRFREEAEGQDVVEVTLMVDIKRTANDCGYYFPSVVA
jgi:hypothetical protein